MSLAFWKQCCMYNLANSEDLQSYNIPIVFPSVQRCPLNSLKVQNNINTVLFPCCCVLHFWSWCLKYTEHINVYCLVCPVLSWHSNTQRVALFLCLKFLVLSQCTLLLWILYWCTTHHKYNSTRAGCWIPTEFEPSTPAVMYFFQAGILFFCIEKA